MIFRSNIVLRPYIVLGYIFPIFRYAYRVSANVLWINKYHIFAHRIYRILGSWILSVVIVVNVACCVMRESVVTASDPGSIAHLKHYVWTASLTIVVSEIGHFCVPRGLLRILLFNLVPELCFMNGSSRVLSSGYHEWQSCCRAVAAFIMASDSMQVPFRTRQLGPYQLSLLIETPKLSKAIKIELKLS